MLCEALLRGRAGVGSAARHHSQRARHDLNRLFQCSDSKRELTKSLRILPDYFSHELVEQFTNSPLYASFQGGHLEYEQQPSAGMALESVFSAPRLQRFVGSQESLRYLEVYLHWLLNHCGSFNLHENNYAMEMLNLELPEKWFQIKDFAPHRTFVYHHGPTNSGKSTAAIAELRALKGNERGIYMAPLRLLAWEYQQKLENCSLITGQEKDFKNLNLISCTIQAAPLNDEYDVAVIDEIQMIGDGERGWAWTKAVLGIKAKRIHLCGDERALGIVSKLLEKTDDILEERRYSRLSKLTLIHRNFKLEKITPGDCVINFSMNSLIKHRNDINKHINSRENAGEEPEEVMEEERTFPVPEGSEDGKGKTNHTAIVYGRLPPECRKSQALKFNMGELPYLVATNAIGMGLNLNIRKVIFLNIDRQTSNGPVELEEHEIQQIAGRAGRGKETGYVQCVNKAVLKRVQKALSKVNETYGIQLENIKDDGNQSEQPTPDEEKPEEDKMQVFSPLLRRFLKEKECSIKTASFYFQNDYIILCKLALEELLGKLLTNMEIVNYLRSYTKIGSLYSLQETKSMAYLFGLLENRNLDQAELFMLYNGLGLSIPNQSAPKSIRQVMENSHRQYIDQFVRLRKVDLPLLIVQLHHQDFESFRYMDQIAELQFYFNLIESYVWLWGKFQFAFHQIKLAKDIKKALSEKISAVLMSNEFMRDRQEKGYSQDKNSFIAASRQNPMQQHRKPQHHPHKQEQKQERKQEYKQEHMQEPKQKQERPIFNIPVKKISKQVKPQSKDLKDNKVPLGFFKKASLIKQQEVKRLKKTQSPQQNNDDAKSQSKKRPRKKREIVTRHKANSKKQTQTSIKIHKSNPKVDDSLKIPHRKKEKRPKDAIV